VYDIRNESHVSKITNKATRLSLASPKTAPSQSSQNNQPGNKGAWSDWWKEKR